MKMGAKNKREREGERERASCFPSFEKIIDLKFVSALRRAVIP